MGLFVFILLFLLGCLHNVGQQPFFKLTGEWKSIGPDGGDMHFVYITSNHILFASHGFGGLWRSTDRGENWEYVENKEWVDTNFMAMDEINETIIGGGNNGLWLSNDNGITWKKIPTGNDDIDNGKYEIVSIVALSENHILFSIRFSSVHGFYELKDGVLHFYELPENARNAVVMLAYGRINGIPILFVSSSEKGLFTYEFSKGKWDKILNKRTTRVAIKNGTVYVGTIGDWYYMGKFNKKWQWEHIDVVGKKCGVASFIVPDPYNPKWLWIGASGRGHIFSSSGGASFVASGYYDRGWKEIHFKYNYATMIAIDKNASGESIEGYAVDTKYGKIAKYAFVPQGGAGCIQRTQDGGKTWEKAYNGIYGDTINKISYIENGVREGDIVVTCVSGTQITGDMGESWYPGIDFTLGDIGYGLPGYAWGAASPPEKLEGKYDLLIATGYPPENFTGNGIYAVDATFENPPKRIFDVPCFDMVISGNKLYAGRMDSGVSIIDLNTYKANKVDGIPSDEAGINLKHYNEILYISTIKGGNKNSDHYFFSDKNTLGGLYLYDGNKCKKIYNGKRIISFSVNGNKIYAISCDGRLMYFKNNEKKWEISLPEATYSDMAVDWDKRIIYFSTFDTQHDGVLYASFYSAKRGNFYPLQGLPTKMVRCLLFVNGVLFAGTEGYSVWKIEPKRIFNYEHSLLVYTP